MKNANIKYSEVPLIKKIEKCNDNILYYGEGGIGKTTQMQLAFNYFSSKCTNTVPIFLDADKEIDFRKADPLMSAIASKYLGSDIETDDIWKLFTNNSSSSAKNYTYIIFVDGINELTQNNKGYLIEKITHIIDESKNTRFIISSRIKENLGLRFKNIAIKPLEKKNILKYLGENYGVNDNSKNINDSLVEILQIPLYLSVFKNTYKGSDYKPNIYDESTVRKADILDSYIQKILHEKRKTNAADTVLFEFIVKYFLPALAFEMVKENMFSIDYDSADRFCESTKYFKGIAKRRFVDFNINSADTICVSNCALLEAHNDVYTFPHQIWRDYFCAKHIINCLNVAYSDQIQNDLEVPVDNEIRGFVGQLIYTYDEKLHYSKEEHFPPEKSCRMCECDFEAKDNLEDWDKSPIEHYMQQHNLEQKEQNQISPLVTRNLIEIMKNSRNNHIISNYDYLDLRKTNFFEENNILQNSSFNEAKIIKDIFTPKIEGKIKAIAISDNGEKSAYLYWNYNKYYICIISENNSTHKTIPNLENISYKEDLNDFSIMFHKRDTKIIINYNNTKNSYLEYSIKGNKFKLIKSNNNKYKTFPFTISSYKMNNNEIILKKKAILINGKTVYATTNKYLMMSYCYKSKYLAVTRDDGNIDIFKCDIMTSSLRYLYRIYNNSINILTISVNKTYLEFYNGQEVFKYNLTDDDFEFISSFMAFYSRKLWGVKNNYVIFETRKLFNKIRISLFDRNKNKIIDTKFFTAESLEIGTFNGCFALIDNNIIEIWGIEDEKFKKIKTRNLFFVNFGNNKADLRFSNDEESILVNEKKIFDLKEVQQFQVEFNEKIYNSFIKQDRIPIINANIINCKFDYSCFLDKNKKDIELIKYILKQNGAKIETNYKPYFQSIYTKHISTNYLIAHFEKKHHITLTSDEINQINESLVTALNSRKIQENKIYNMTENLIINLKKKKSK